MSQSLDPPDNSAWVTGSPTGIERRSFHGVLEANRSVIGVSVVSVSPLARFALIREFYHEFSRILPSLVSTDRCAECGAPKDAQSRFCTSCGSTEKASGLAGAPSASLGEASVRNRWLSYLPVSAALSTIYPIAGLYCSGVAGVILSNVWRNSDDLRRAAKSYALGELLLSKPVMSSTSARSSVAWSASHSSGGLRDLLSHRLRPFRTSGSAQIIRLDRIPVPGHSSYPLKRRFLATIIREGPAVRISLTSMRPSLLPSGSGPDLETALNDLGRHLQSMVLEHRNIPPHVRGPESSGMQRVLNHLVDWEQYERENPVIQPLWGRIESRTPVGLSIFWSVGPDGLQDKIGTLADKDVPASLSPIGVGQWFYGAAKCYPNRIEWVEEPHVVPDPTDLEARRALWESLPRVPADEPGCWPLKKK
jgi:hypothetical protein